MTPKPTTQQTTESTTQQMQAHHPQMSLRKSKALATSLLLGMTGLWVLLLIIANHFHAYKEWIYVLVLGAEAGMVGGLADWYAVTVLFRDPFKHIWVPKILREHTAIIPNNQSRIAHSMGRFVQENFLAPHIVRAQINQHDVMLYVGQWLAVDNNAAGLTKEIQRLVPSFLRMFENPQISLFLRQNTVQWIQETEFNRPIARTMHAMFDNDLHRDVFQVLLEAIDGWITNNPSETDKIIEGVIDQTGMLSFLSKGAAMLGFDVKSRAVQAILQTIKELSHNVHHPIRQIFEESMNQWAHALEQDDSEQSQQIHELKMGIASSPTIVNFIASVVSSLRERIIEDLEAQPSAIGKNIHQLFNRIGEQLIGEPQTRQAFNAEITDFATYLSERYAGTVVDYVRQQIIDWDTRDMITKIETEVGGDLQMIRVNGVVVGSFIGLLLGLVRLWIEH